MIVSSRSQINIRSKFISFAEPNVLCKDAEGELGSLVTDAADVDDLRPFPRLRPVMNDAIKFQIICFHLQNDFIYTNTNLRHSASYLCTQFYPEKLVQKWLNYLQIEFKIKSCIIITKKK